MVDEAQYKRFKTGYGAGKVHYGRRLERFPTTIALACSGRAVGGACQTDAAATCKACIKKQGS